MNKQFEKELKELLEKHKIKMTISCYDMTAIIAYNDSESVDNVICEQGESKHEYLIINDYLDINTPHEK